jgi:hypothetical protein
LEQLSAALVTEAELAEFSCQIRTARRRSDRTLKPDRDDRCVQNTERAPVDLFGTAQELLVPTALPWGNA